MGDVRISAKSSLTTLNRWIEVIAGNLVGANIYGFKGTRLSFGDTLVDLIRGGTGTTSQGGLNPIQVGTGGISIGGTATDFSQGSIIQTRNNGDLAIQGNAFFAAVDAAGKITYTRNGEFHFDDQGNLVTNDGLYVLGIFDTQKDLGTPGPCFVDYGGGSGIGMTFNMSTLVGYSSKGALITASCYVGIIPFGIQTIQKYIYDPLDPLNVDMLGATLFVWDGALITTTGTKIDLQIGLITVGAVGYPITLKIDPAQNTQTNTSTINARFFAAAINAVSNDTGIGASVIINSNDLSQAAITLMSVQRTLTEQVVRLTTTASGQVLSTQLTSARAGILGTAKDTKNNLFYRVNIKTMVGKAPQYIPQAGDKFHFDGTGMLINDSRGKDATSAPPFNTGIHILLNKFSNNDGLQKVRGSSQFQYTEAVGNIVVGYAGMDKGKDINTKFGLEISGTSIIGTENIVVPQGLEASNTSVTEMLPELTLAQKTFTSNTKVVNVGNSIVDDLNGLIR